MHEEVVDSVLEILNSDGTEHVTREEASEVVKEVNGDISRALDELWNLITIKQMTSISSTQSPTSDSCSSTKEHQEINPAWQKVCQELDEAEKTVKQSVEAPQMFLQWREICEALGLHECDEFIEILSKLSLQEKQSIFASKGFFQQLLASFQEDTNGDDEDDDDHYQEEKDLALGRELQRLEALALEQENEHPLTQLQTLFPSYKLNVIEQMYENEGYNLEKTVAALMDIQAIDGIQTYAAILSSSKPKGFTTTKSATGVAPIQAISYIQRDICDEQLKVDSLGHFPILPRTPSPHTSRRGRQRDQKQQQDLKQRLVYKSPPKEPPVNAWDHSQEARINQYGHWEFGLNTKLKIERLQETLQGIDKEVIYAALLSNGGNSIAAEAALREIYLRPLDQSSIQTKQQRIRLYKQEEEEEEEQERRRFIKNQTQEKEFITVVRVRKKQKRVEKVRDEMHTKYCSALKYFNHSTNHLLGIEKIRELSRLRQQLRQAQREKADAFFEANQIHIHRHQPIDLHGLIVMEALYVVKQCLLYCQEQKITKCRVICGMGHHSSDGKARLLQATEIFLTRKGILYRKDHGLLIFYPFRNK